MPAGNIRASATRITCWGSLLLLSAVACKDAGSRAAVVDTTHATAVTGTVENGKTRLEIRGGVKLLRTVIVDRDSTVPAFAAPSNATVIGDIPGVAVIVVDTYATRPGGMSYCQAGEEQYLRVIPLIESQDVQTSTTKIASCRENIELAAQGVEWRADSSLVRIHWLTGPTPGAKGETRTLRVGPNAAVEVVKP